jgi:cell division protease FtsH
MDAARIARRLLIARGSLAALARDHVGAEGPATFVDHDVVGDPGVAAITMLRFFEELGAPIHGYQGRLTELFRGISQLGTRAHESPMIVRVTRRDGQADRGLSEGLAFVRIDGDPSVVLARWRGDFYGISVAARSEIVGQRLLERLAAFQRVQSDLSESPPVLLEQSLNARIRRHVGVDDHAIIQHEFASFERANVAIVLLDELHLRDAEILGVEPKQFGGVHEASAFVQAPTVGKSGELNGLRAMPSAIERVHVVGDEYDNGLVSGVCLYREGDEPVVAIVQRDGQGIGSSTTHLAIVARAPEAAQASLDALLHACRQKSIFRGRVIRPELGYREDVEEAEILEVPPAKLDDLVLPADLLDRIRTDIIEYVTHAPSLAAHGLTIRRGILLHGPPGVGKSFLCRVLASELPGFTTIVLSGMNLFRPAGAFQLARHLAPALLVLEDVDLVGGERSINAHSEVLGTLMNELDGLAPEDMVLVVFTANRLEQLEPALVARPGRVDVVLAFGLPGDEQRRRLVRQYAGHAEIADDALEWAVGATDGTTPAFIRELMKSAVLEALRGGSVEGELATIHAPHVRAAIARLEGKTDARTQRLLGFRS